MSNQAVIHELLKVEGGSLICLETGERDYQVTAVIEGLPMGLQPVVVAARGSTPTEAMIAAVTSGAFDRLEFQTASDTLTLRVCRRTN